MSQTTIKQIYWIEDHLELFQRTLKKFKAASGSVKQFKTASALLNSLFQIKDSFGSIIVDLWVPPGEGADLPRNVRGPQIGMWLLEQISAELGKGWPIFILSGNLTVDVTVTLGRDYDIPESRVYAKPLVDKADEFVRSVLDAATNELSTVE